MYKHFCKPIIFMTKLFIPQETHPVNLSYPQFASSFFAACVLWFDTKSVDSNLLVDFTRAENRAWEIGLLIKQNKTIMDTVNKIDFFLMVQSYFWCYLITVVTCEQMQLTPCKPQYPHINSPHWSSYISLKN